MELKKSSRITLLRPQILSIALGIAWALLCLLVTLMAMVSGQAGRLVQIFQLVYPGYALTAGGLVIGLIWAYLYGWLTGFLIGYFYSKKLIRDAEKHSTTIVEIEPEKRVNLIQPGAGEKAYTIVILANPAIYLHADAKAIADPIIDDKALFYKVVLRCLRSFAKNELLSIPEIKNRLRIITIFEDKPERIDPENPDNVLCEDLEGPPGNLVKVIAPRYIDGQPGLIQDYVRNTEIDNNAVKSLEHVDVVFMVSASDDLTRSAARFTTDDNSRPDATGKTGATFTFDFQNPDTLEVTSETRQHAFFAKYPGTVALSAWDDRLKVPVHEFAHAMSSHNNGIIYDEYVDKYHDNTIDADNAPGLQRVINRKHRQTPADPIPDVFCTYEFDGEEGVYPSEEVKYPSDRHRNDKPPNWTSYAPGKEDIHTSCIMDFTYHEYLFDKLVFDFMYDRLMTKMKRR